MLYGYARVSATDQNLSIQTETLSNYGCSVIRKESLSGTSTGARVELRTLLDFIREGDSLVVTRVDRLARSVGDLQDIVRELQSKGANLVMTEQQIDTSKPAGRAFLNMLGVFAEFETQLREERQREGIAKAREAGTYAGRTPPRRQRDTDPAPIAAYAERHGATAAAKHFRIARSNVYRAIETMKEGAA